MIHEKKKSTVQILLVIQWKKDGRKTYKLRDPLPKLSNFLILGKTKQILLCLHALLSNEMTEKHGRWFQQKMTVWFLSEDKVAVMGSEHMEGFQGDWLSPISLMRWKSEECSLQNNSLEYISIVSGSLYVLFYNAR